ncbi:SLAP domain-containing protein [Companilactobacillus sp. FL22-1]|uniref:SLAP domain-containing protein n=1 Tax=Companilactobacillus sp. FL22-1 TaxID=3373892 RepID=UPI003754E3F8
MKKSFKISMLLAWILMSITGFSTPVLAASDFKTVTVYPDNGPIALYDRNGRKISNVKLAANSNLAIAKTAQINGRSYYQISKDYYIRTNQAYGYQFTIERIKITAKPMAVLKDSHGKTLTNRAIAGSSIWGVDKVIQINGTQYYRISANEFVSSKDIKIIR